MTAAIRAALSVPSAGTVAGVGTAGAAGAQVYALAEACFASIAACFFLPGPRSDLIRRVACSLWPFVSRCANTLDAYYY